MSIDRPWYRRFPAQFLTGVIGLKLDEIGAYAVVLELIYERRGPVPDDEKAIASRMGCNFRKWRVLRAQLIAKAKLFETDGCLMNRAAQKEIGTGIIGENKTETVSPPLSPPLSPPPSPPRVRGKKSNDFSRANKTQNQNLPPTPFKGERSPHSLAPKGARSAHSKKTNGSAGPPRSTGMTRDEALRRIDELNRRNAEKANAKTAKDHH